MPPKQKTIFVVDDEQSGKARNDAQPARPVDTKVDCEAKLSERAVDL